MSNFNTMENVFKLSTRPQEFISQKQDETVEIEPKSIQTLIYIKDCVQCRMILNKKPVKVVVDKCQDLVLNICAELVSGTLEVIKSSNITINIEGEVKISTITADSTKFLEVNLSKDEKQLESLYFHQSSNLTVTVGTGDERKEFVVTALADDPEYLQFVCRWELQDGAAKLVTEKVTREGAYPYSEMALQKSRSAECRESNGFS